MNVKKSFQALGVIIFVEERPRHRSRYPPGTQQVGVEVPLLRPP